MTTAVLIVAALSAWTGFAFGWCVRATWRVRS